jgi:NADPH:quinone reductase-like Zn-dependent oxidoreductase
MKLLGNDYEPEDGTFAEYFVTKGDIAIHIPENISFEEAATLGCGIFTVALGFYRYLELPFLTLPLKENTGGCPPILIYGGSSATGTLAIQFAKLFVILSNLSTKVLIKFQI